MNSNDRDDNQEDREKARLAELESKLSKEDKDMTADLGKNLEKAGVELDSQEHDQNSIRNENSDSSDGLARERNLAKEQNEREQSEPER